ncbi:homeobox protein BEL1-like protein [Sesbania bispinosa]|nr:homeobox protein BEL1-like protein [Sesbania bispinosa]
MQTHLSNQIHGFVSELEMFNIDRSMEMIGFHKQEQSDNNALAWKSLFQDHERVL